MKIHAVKDKAGKVLATFESIAGEKPSITPVLEDGHRLEEMEVADNYRDQIKAFYEKHG